MARTIAADSVEPSELNPILRRLWAVLGFTESGVISFTAPDGGAEIALAHGLSGGAPAGYYAISRSGPGVLYDGPTAWTASHIYLRSTEPGTFKIVVVR